MDGMETWDITLGKVKVIREDVCLADAHGRRGLLEWFLWFLSTFNALLAIVVLDEDLDIHSQLQNIIHHFKCQIHQSIKMP